MMISYFDWFILKEFNIFRSNYLQKYTILFNPKRKNNCTCCKNVYIYIYIAANSSVWGKISDSYANLLSSIVLSFYSDILKKSLEEIKIIISIFETSRGTKK